MFGILVAWVLVRYQFPLKRLFDSLVDLPFALPTAVAGIALTSIYAPSGWLGKPLLALGIHVAYTRLGIVVALTFIGLPFVVRTVQPVLEDLDAELEEAAASLGAGPPANVCARLAADDSAGRADRFCAGLRPRRRRVRLGDLHRRQHADANRNYAAADRDQLEQYDYAGATAIAVAMLVVSFAMLLTINVLQKWSGHHGGAAGPKPSLVLEAIELPGGRPPAAASRSRSATEPPAVRWLLIGIAAAFLALFLFLPLAVVFATAFEKGVGAYLRTFSDPDTLAAIRLTILTAVIAVPLNVVFGIAAAWVIGKFEFVGKSVLVTLIDLPFSVSPVVAGLVFVLLFGMQGLLGPWRSRTEFGSSLRSRASFS